MLKFRKMYMVAVGLTLATALSGLATAGTCEGCGDDAQIKAAITTSFQERPYLGAPNSIQVQTVNRVVYLSGGVSAGLIEPNRRGDCASDPGRRASGEHHFGHQVTVSRNGGPKMRARAARRPHLNEPTPDSVRWGPAQAVRR